MTEQKLIVILTLENQFEANRMKVVLEQNKIPFIIKEYNDLEYGNIKGKRGWGRLESYAEYQQDILKLYKEGFNTEPISDEMVNEEPERIYEEPSTIFSEIPEADKPKRSYWSGITIFLLLIISSFLGYKVYDLKQIIDRPSKDKNFTREYKRYSTLLKWARTGNDYYYAEDMKHNGIFNKSSYYDPQGKLAHISYDENEDGIHEKSVSFFLNNDTLGMAYDLNADGLWDKSYSNLRKNFRLGFQDVDFDRICDSISVNDKVYSVEEFMKLFK